MIKTNIEDIYNTDEEPKKIDYNINRNRIYFSRRYELFNLIKLINNYIHSNSQSLYLAFYFMDTIFTNDDLEREFFSHFTNLSYLSPLNDIQMNNYVLLSLACLILTQKFSDNGPKNPSISSFIKLAYHFSKKKYSFNTDDLILAEVVVIKLLKYKLTYNTIYHFLVFFFTHGIIFKITLQRSELYWQLSEKQILEKIYVVTREILDHVIESSEYYNFFYGKDNHLIVVESLLWSIGHVLGITITDSENLFKLIYNININENIKIQINEIIERLYTKKKGKIGYTYKPIFAIYNYSKKNAPINNQVTRNPITLQKNNNNYKIISSQNNNKKYMTSSYNNIYNSLQTNDESFSFYNEIIHNKLDDFNKNYTYQNKIPNKSLETYTVNKIDSSKTISLNNRNFYNSNKNIISNYDVNSMISIESPHISKIIHNSTNLLNNEFLYEKSPVNKNESNRNIMEGPSDNNKIKRIHMIKGIEFEKKSLSFCKESNNSFSRNINTNSNHQKGSTIIDTSYINNNNTYSNLNIEDELMFEEKINKPKVFNNKIKVDINNYLNSISPTNNDKKEKKDLFKNYMQCNKNDHNLKRNKEVINKLKQIPKSKIISFEELQKRTKNLCTVTKLNKTLENEPKDNNRNRINNLRKNNGLFYIKSCNNFNLSNKQLNNSKNNNTIIINNNIQINNYFDKNINESKSSVNANGPKDNSRTFIYNTFTERNIDDLMFFPGINNSMNRKDSIIRKKYVYNNKNGNNFINKSNTVTNKYNGFNNEYNGYIYNNQFQFY
jgi:hypothetical protein